jgi:hypothetical protein
MNTLNTLTNNEFSNVYTFNEYNYVIFNHIDFDIIKTEVNKYNQEGWETIGRILLDNKSPTMLYQAIVRKPC